MKLELTISDDADLRALVKDLIASEIKSIVREEVRTFIREEAERLTQNALNDQMIKEVEKLKSSWLDSERAIRSEIRNYLDSVISIKVNREDCYKSELEQKLQKIRDKQNGSQ